jgi:hypothetical protein
MHQHVPDHRGVYLCNVALVQGRDLHGKVSVRVIDFALLVVDRKASFVIGTEIPLVTISIELHRLAIEIGIDLFFGDAFFA